MRDIQILQQTIENQCPEIHKKRLRSLMLASKAGLDGYFPLPHLKGEQHETEDDHQNGANCQGDIVFLHCSKMLSLIFRVDRHVQQVAAQLVLKFQIDNIAVTRIGQDVFA